MLQDSLNDEGTASDEFKAVSKLLSTHFNITRK